MLKLRNNIRFLLFLIGSQCYHLAYAQQDPLLKLVDVKPVKIVRQISIKDSVGVKIQEITFQFNDTAEVYAVITSPIAKGNYPGMLVLHGGGGSAEKDKAISWAQRGYVAVAPDLPGIAEPKKLTNTKGRWNTLTYGAERYIANPDVTTSIIFDAVQSAMQALHLLQAQTNVDKKHIGVVGISWGGYMTTMVCALAGQQVKAGFSVFGCGFYEYTSQVSTLDKMALKEKQDWLQYLDAGRRVNNMKASFFIAGATNDFFFYPKAVQRTLDAIQAEKNQVYAPNVSHKIPLPGGSFEDSVNAEPFTPTAFQPYPTPKGNKANWLSMEVPYMEYYLKQKGTPFPVVNALMRKESNLVDIQIKSALSLTNVVVYWSDACADVKKCVWTSLQPKMIDQLKYQFELPSQAKQWFVVASDERPVSVSSRLFIEE
jgi:dienelactone hydrolase